MSDADQVWNAAPVRHRPSQAGEATNAPEDAPVLEPAELPGAVLMIPNRHWGYELAHVVDHPGACAFHDPGALDAVLVSGTDAENMRARRAYHVAEPTPENGLSKPTAFLLAPRTFRLHRLKTYFPERFIGRLSDADLAAIRAELARLFPAEGA